MTTTALARTPRVRCALTHHEGQGQAPAALPKHERLFLAQEAATAARRGLSVPAHRDAVGELLGTYHALYAHKVTAWIAQKVKTSSLAPRMDVEAMVQETFYRVQRGLLRGKTLKTPNTYFTKAGGSVFLDTVRRLNGERTVGLEVRSAPGGDDDFHALELVDPRQDPEAALRTREEAQVLFQVLQQLTPLQRHALLRDGKENSTVELAAQLGVPVGQLKSVRHRALLQLPRLAAQLGLVQSKTP